MTLLFFFFFENLSSVASLYESNVRHFFEQESFCEEVQGLLDKLYGLIQGNTELVKQWTSIYVTFCKVSLLGKGYNLRKK